MPAWPTSAGSRGRPTAFGNALGESIKDQMISGGSSGGSGRTQPDANTVVDNRPYAQPAGSSDLLAALTGMMGDAGPTDRSGDVQLAAGDGFTMGRGPVSVGQSGRTVYISDQGSQPSIDSMLAEAQAQVEALKASSTSTCKFRNVMPSQLLICILSSERPLDGSLQCVSGLLPGID
ncbi:MAG: hypothetical protein KA185_08445, partial [Vitreoscilla sp.]|nr:hypothetical protein [Vitreoscilla sp.]